VLGVGPAKAIVSQFADGETQVQVQESVRGLDVYIFQRFVRGCVLCVCGWVGGWVSGWGGV
jgi:hypothetical protein